MSKELALENYERMLHSMNGTEVRPNDYHISNKPIGTRNLCDCIGVVISSDLEAGLAHVYPTGFQPQNNLSDLLMDLLRRNSRVSLIADVITGLDNDYGLILKYLSEHQILLRNTHSWGMSAKHLIYVPETKSLMFYSRFFPTGFNLNLRLS